MKGVCTDTAVLLQQNPTRCFAWPRVWGSQAWRQSYRYINIKTKPSQTGLRTPAVQESFLLKAGSDTTAASIPGPKQLQKFNKLNARHGWVPSVPS